MNPHVRLVLSHVDFERVEFTAVLPDGFTRDVSVLVASGSSWTRAVRFPHGTSPGGESLGADTLDASVRERAAEELVRLSAVATRLSTEG